MNPITFLVLRLAIGASMFGHGLVRLPKMAGFSNWMVGSFQKSMVPESLVTPFSYMLPILELTVGFFLLVGLFTKPALIAGALLMVLLIFGAAMIENWDAITTQLVHTAFFAILLQYVQYNSYAVDRLLNK